MGARLALNAADRAMPRLSRDDRHNPLVGTTPQPPRPACKALRRHNTPDLWQREVAAPMALPNAPSRPRGRRHHPKIPGDPHAPCRASRDAPKLRYGLSAEPRVGRRSAKVSGAHCQNRCHHERCGRLDMVGSAPGTADRFAAARASVRHARSWRRSALKQPSATR
jgi:hypothetical protein